jgi:undecaprenyl-diphosphatase
MGSEFHAIVLGIVQGLTEFLPVSSSAHLIIVPRLLGWNDPGLAFDVALHLGSLVALLVYYWKDWWRIAGSLVTGEPRGRRLLGLLIVASVPGALFGLLFEKQAETVFRSLFVIAPALAILGVALWIFDLAAPQEVDLEGINFGHAILIGLAQAFALIPGVSRSGITITVGRLLRINRQDAANFSFLMSAPIIGGAGLLEARHLIQSGLTGELVAGFVASAIFSLLAIAMLISYVRTRTYQVFAWYRLALALFLVIVLLSHSGWL